MNPHLERAFNQENQIWKYVIVFLLSLFISQTVGSIPLVITLVIKIAQNGSDFVKPENPMDFGAYGIDPNFGLILMLIPFVVMFVVSMFLIHSLHKRSLMDVVNGGRSFRWTSFGIGFFIWGIISFAIIVISVSINQYNYELQFNVRTFIPLVLISLFVLPLQSGSEEFLFRGYLSQGIAARTNSNFWVILIPSMVFALIHGMNPEIKEFGFWLVIPLYFLFGVFLAIITIMDDGIEMAIGLHGANNIMSCIFVTSKSSALQTPALFYEKETYLAEQYWSFLIAAFLCLLMLQLIYRWNFKKLLQPILEVEEAI
ncbi:CPBP family intramembrane glutamic endopeptidase [Maribellus sediminis]|uniref:CPBP family intramembrane glutamic endopeptidase n=1 Tax=Maribellus sediminis TaxID=2696285 RepID=UPI001431BF34|nr:CPBP family intramembrane glutamic endopeptidase [Maribellus sediminis]